jgi:hypothetical protein
VCLDPLSTWIAPESPSNPVYPNQALPGAPHAGGASWEEEPEAYQYRRGTFYMTTAEAAEFYWMDVLI